MNLIDLSFLRMIHRHGGQMKLTESDEQSWEKTLKHLKSTRYYIIKKTGVWYLTVKGEMVAREWVKLDMDIIAFNTLTG